MNIYKTHKLHIRQSFFIAVSYGTKKNCKVKFAGE